PSQVRSIASHAIWCPGRAPRETRARRRPLAVPVPTSSLLAPAIFRVPLAAPMSLTIRSLRKSYPDVVAVDGLDLDVRAGECFGLLGPNGAGKTTTIEICEGLTSPDSGDVIVLGRRWTEQPRELRERLGIQLQETQLSEKLTVEETVRLFRSFFREGREVSDVIALVQLEEKQHSRVGGLSGGQKQRLALA